MLSVADFILKYDSYTDEELFEIYTNIEQYNNEAREALAIVMEKRGGRDAVNKKMVQQEMVQQEIKRIHQETVDLGKQGIDVDFIKTTTRSGLLSTEKVNELIDNKYREVEQELKDEKINPRTIVGSIIGAAIASLTGGILWGMSMIFSQRIFYIFIVGLAFFCYGVIKLATKQTKNNKLVLVASVISFIIALLIGRMLYAMIGYIP